MVDFCFVAADSQNVWESVPFLAVWQGRHSSNRPTTTDDGHHFRWSAQSRACSRWVSTSCSSSSYWSPVFAESSILMMRFLQQNTHTHAAQIWEAWSCSGNFLKKFPCLKKVVLKYSKKIFLLQEVGLEVFLEFFLLEYSSWIMGFCFVSGKSFAHWVLFAKLRSTKIQSWDEPRSRCNQLGVASINESNKEMNPGVTINQLLDLQNFNKILYLGMNPGPGINWVDLQLWKIKFYWYHSFAPMCWVG